MGSFATLTEQQKQRYGMKANAVAEHRGDGRILVGDANGDGVVNSADATITRNRSGATTDGTNFRTDFNTDGTVNAADATIVRNASGHFVP
ncbi:MAG: dockerin type I domain-containing protein [Verrucomicrobiota bacterium]|nr:dockerin type I domain-containing protein [Verrucomicrobiota bacterium]